MYKVPSQQRDYRHKLWASDQTAHRPRATASKPPCTSTLPANRWVEVNSQSFPEDFVSIKESVLPWLHERKIKYQICQVQINDQSKQVFLFKKTTHALLFKLTWG